MNDVEYLSASERTEKKFPEGMRLSVEHQVIFRFLMEDLVKIGSGFDHMKKHLVYGAELEMSAPPSEYLTPKHLDQKQAELMHAAMGKITEAIEAAEPIMNHVLHGRDLDMVNVQEEVYDGHWYDAIIARHANQPFSAGWDINIAKLKKRFPEKFDEGRAMNRDLDSERAILEEGHSE